MRRFLLYDNLGAPLGEIAEADVFEAILREVVNGEHSLEITTTQVLDKGTRILYEDGRGYWYEFVVCGVDGEHASGNRVIGTYYCVWSIQHDLQGVPVSIMPGVQNPVTAGTALHAILDATDRWSYGTVTNTNTGGASMYDTNAWDALSILVENWGGEIDVTIGVDFISGVVSRAVDLYAQQGSSTPTRRFDFGRDLQSVKRTYDDAPFYCRISPRGKGEQTDAGGYGRKITIESVNDGKDYLEYAPMVDVAKLPDGNGGYEYPTLKVENSKCETPAALKTWAQGVLADYCTPKITYTISAVQAAVAGVDVQGVSLGDAVEIVDRKFGADGLRLTGRVVELTIDMLQERNVRVVIGNAQESVSSQLSSLQKSIDTISSWPSVAMGADVSTADYLNALLNSINTEINATGGYTYITQGSGIRTYDTAVTDPLVGSEASQVVEIKGGSIRIANTKTSGGDWEWKSVFTSGHIATDMITALNVTAGMIQSHDGKSYWDLDGSVINLSGSIQLTTPGVKSGSTHYQKLTTFTYSDYLGNSRTVPGLLLYSENETHPSRIALTSLGTTSGYSSSNQSYYAAAMIGYGPIDIEANIGATIKNILTLGSQWAELISYNGGNSMDMTVKPRQISFSAASSNNTVFQYMSSVATAASSATNVTTTHAGNFKVTGTKNRLVETENYDERLLYSYETTSPMFGDIGSGVLDSTGYCYVSVDDVFSETARTDINYQVFLQACGAGALYVESKSSTHFVVRGEPGLAFDWEVKCRQLDYPHLRLENDTLQTGIDEEYNYGDSLTGAYHDENEYITQMEQLFDEELAAC